ncbi:MAG: phosphotransferase [Clostridiales bacterium]|nr:phosphotransferase [Clostridiales bacterium]
MARELVSRSSTKEVYRDGHLAIKVFCEGFPKSEVLNEALTTARIEEVGGILIPATLAVSVEGDGRWAITKEFIYGKTLQQLMDENPDRMDEYLDEMSDLQISIHEKRCPLLTKMKDKMARQISELTELDRATRYDLQTRLESTPKRDKLCHGDFQPENIIVADDGSGMYILDWVHATQGNAGADVARTYQLLCLRSKEIADQYVSIYCRKTGTDRRYIEQWLPIVASAQLTKHRPEEAELLRQCLEEIFEYE